MNQPAPRELCEKLQAMGCVGESDFFYDPETSEICWGPSDKSNLEIGFIQVYFQNDFTGATERAEENSRKAWGERSIFLSFKNDYDREQDVEVKIFFPAYITHRMNIIGCHLGGEEWFQYLERTMRT